MNETAERRRLMLWVMLAVLAWGSLLALGAGLFGLDAGSGDVGWSPNVWRGMIVEGCVLAFVGGWWFLAACRR